MEADLVHFNHIFDKWAEAYDDTVYKEHGEYHEVFIGYQEILRKTVEKIQQEPGSLVIDIGTGTGNLGKEAYDQGYQVIGIEPNDAMREQGIKKHPEIHFCSGSFLELSFEEASVDSIISSYAFHHLTDQEKKIAAGEFYKLLTEAGTVVIADTMYETELEGRVILKDAQNKGYHALAEDLQREFYTTHEVLRNAFEEAGFTVSFERMNKFVWILQAKKA